MVSVTQWFREGAEKRIPDNMIYKEAAVKQAVFFRDTIAAMFAPVTKDPNKTPSGHPVWEERLHFCKIRAFHTSKSVQLPVYQFNHPRLTCVARDNFYNWNVTLDFAERPPSFPKYFELNVGDVYLFCEGMEDMKQPVYRPGSSRFTFCVWDNYKLYSVMCFVAHVVGPNHVEM